MKSSNFNSMNGFSSINKNKFFLFNFIIPHGVHTLIQMFSSFFVTLWSIIYMSMYKILVFEFWSFLLSVFVPMYEHLQTHSPKLIIYPKPSLLCHILNGSIEMIRSMLLRPWQTPWGHYWRAVTNVFKKQQIRMWSRIKAEKAVLKTRQAIPCKHKCKLPLRFSWPMRQRLTKRLPRLARPPPWDLPRWFCPCARIDSKTGNFLDSESLVLAPRCSWVGWSCLWWRTKCHQNRNTAWRCSTRESMPKVHRINDHIDDS